MSSESSLVESLRNIARELEADISRMQGRLEGVNLSIEEVSRKSKRPNSYTQSVRRPQMESKGGPTRSAIFQILKQNGPMHRKDIQEALKTYHNIDIDDMRIIASYLSIDPRFEPVTKGSGMWTLTEELETSPTEEGHR